MESEKFIQIALGCANTHGGTTPQGQTTTGPA
jgi:hypothetical protein